VRKSQLPERLKETLKANSMSQSELARRINMSSDTIQSYCSGKRVPPADVLFLICKALGESSDYLLGLTDIST
jgi:transcriptional regulator with XRE-family HTH domain